LVAESMDLDPAAAGQQTTVTVYGGTFEWQPGGQVAFTPDGGFAGKAQASYTVADSLGRLSNVANLGVTVKPSPTGAMTLFSFETGTEGWAGGSWQEAPGTVTQTTAFHTNGAYGLQIDSANAWFGLDFPAPFDLTGKTHLKFDMQTLAAGTSTQVAIKTGPGWAWCEGGGWVWTNPGRIITVEIDLTDMSCTPDLSDVRGMFVYFNPGTFYIDYVRAE